MEKVLADLRGLRASTGLRQKAIADRMDLSELQLSRILNGYTAPPADFEARFRAAVAELAAEEAQRERVEAEARARAIESAAGIPLATAA